MRHCDPERIALIALGDAATDAEQAHLNVCEACREDLAQDRAVVTTGHEVTDEDVPWEPPARVWAAISAELNLDPALNSTALPLAPTVDRNFVIREVERERNERQQKQADENEQDEQASDVPRIEGPAAAE